MWINKKEWLEVKDQLRRLERLTRPLIDNDLSDGYLTQQAKDVVSKKEVREMIKSYMGDDIGPTHSTVITLLAKQVGMKFEYVAETPSRWELDADI